MLQNTQTQNSCRRPTTLRHPRPSRPRHRSRWTPPLPLPSTSSRRLASRTAIARTPSVRLRHTTCMQLSTDRTGCDRWSSCNPGWTGRSASSWHCFPRNVGPRLHARQGLCPCLEVLSSEQMIVYWYIWPYRRRGHCHGLAQTSGTPAELPSFGDWRGSGGKGPVLGWLLCSDAISARSDEPEGGLTKPGRDGTCLRGTCMVQPRDARKIPLTPRGSSVRVPE